MAGGEFGKPASTHAAVGYPAKYVFHRSQFRIDGFQRDCAAERTVHPLQPEGSKFHIADVMFCQGHDSGKTIEAIRFISGQTPFPPKDRDWTPVRLA
jgi:hypothetical protein